MNCTYLLNKLNSNEILNKGPYAQSLMGMRGDLSKSFEEILVKNDQTDHNELKMNQDVAKAKLLKPGFTRFNLSFFLRKAE